MKKVNLVFSVKLQQTHHNWSFSEKMDFKRCVNAFSLPVSTSTIPAHTSGNVSARLQTKSGKRGAKSGRNRKFFIFRTVTRGKGATSYLPPPYAGPKRELPPKTKNNCPDAAVLHLNWTPRKSLAPAKWFGASTMRKQMTFEKITGKNPKIWPFSGYGGGK